MLEGRVGLHLCVYYTVTLNPILAMSVNIVFTEYEFLDPSIPSLKSYVTADNYRQLWNSHVIKELFANEAIRNNLSEINTPHLAQVVNEMRPTKAILSTSRASVGSVKTCWNFLTC